MKTLPTILVCGLFGSAFAARPGSLAPSSADLQPNPSNSIAASVYATPECPFLGAPLADLYNYAAQNFPTVADTALLVLNATGDPNLTRLVLESTLCSIWEAVESGDPLPVFPPEAE